MPAIGVGGRSACSSRVPSAFFPSRPRHDAIESLTRATADGRLRRNSPYIDSSRDELKVAESARRWESPAGDGAKAGVARRDDAPIDVMSGPITTRLGREGKNAEGTLDERAERPRTPIAGSGSTAKRTRSEDPQRCFPSRQKRVALGSRSAWRPRTSALANVSARDVSVSRPASPSPPAPAPGTLVPRRRRCTARPPRDPRSRRRPRHPRPRLQIPGCRASPRRRG